MAKVNIHRITDKELQWAFRDGDPTTTYAHGLVKLDPFPAYAHDLKRIKGWISVLEDIWPAETDLDWVISEYEEVSRTNAHSNKKFDYYSEREEGEANFSTRIFLSGKRIPISPHMTDYLCTHEYGHNVDYWIAWRKYPEIERDHERDDALEKDYCELRGMEVNKRYGGRNWHTSPGEVFANDFRILVCNIQPEFWPHDEPHPNDLPQIKKWWEDEVKARHDLLKPVCYNKDSVFDHWAKEYDWLPEDDSVANEDAK